MVKFAPCRSFGESFLSRAFGPVHNLQFHHNVLIDRFWSGLRNTGTVKPSGVATAMPI